jgi:hypothetical protein
VSRPLGLEAATEVVGRLRRREDVTDAHLALECVAEFLATAGLCKHGSLRTGKDCPHYGELESVKGLCLLSGRLCLYDQHAQYERERHAEVAP